MDTSLNTSDTVPQNIGKLIKFKELTRILEKIEKTSSMVEKCNILKKQFDSLKEFRHSLLCESNKNNLDMSLFCVLRLFMPKNDGRNSYHLKATRLGKCYVRILGISPSSIEAKHLTTYTVPTTGPTPTDYGDIVYNVLKSRSIPEGDITVADVNLHLDNIANGENNNKQTAVDEEMTKIIKGMSALDQKWMVRIILKNLHLNMGGKRIVKCYNPSAVGILNTTFRLDAVCAHDEQNLTVKNHKLEIFNAVRPMLCEPITQYDIETILIKGDYYLETKMDGERFQLHKNKSDFSFISKNDHDYNKVYGRTRNEGLLAPIMYTLFSDTVDNCILDGEMMVWNKEDQEYHTKGEGIDVKSLKDNDSTRQPCYVAFDILMLNNVSILDKPYAERVGLLDKIFTELPGVFTKCKRIAIRNTSHLLQCINEAFDANEEGVVIKEQNSKYQPNVRNGGWYKIKPDYIEGMTPDLDFLIIGGYYNKRKTFIKGFLLACYVVENGKEEDELAGVFHATAKVTQGLSHAKWIELNEKLKPHWQNINYITIDRKKVIKKFKTNFELGMATPDVWIEPKNSIILEVKCSELIKSDKYTSGYTLRFPRIIGIRDDKLWHHCNTLKDLMKFSTGSEKVVKINKRPLTSDDLVGRKRVKKTITKKVIKKDPVDDTIIIKSKIFLNKYLCVLSGVKYKYQKPELERMIKENSGNVVANPSSKVFVCIAGDLTYEARNYIQAKQYNIVNVNWMIQCIENNKLIKLTPNVMLATTDSLLNEFKLNYDRYGDSYTKKLNENELSNLLNEMDSKALPILTKQELYDLESELFGENNIKNKFRLLTGYFFNNENKSKKLELAYLRFKQYGGDCILEDNVSSSLTHIFYDPNYFNQSDYDAWKMIFFNENNSLNDDENYKLLSYTWIDEQLL